MGRVNPANRMEKIMREGKRERARRKRINAVSDVPIRTSWPRDQFDITGKGSMQWGFGDKRSHRPSVGKSLKQ